MKTLMHVLSALCFTLVSVSVANAGQAFVGGSGNFVQTSPGILEGAFATFRVANPNNFSVTINVAVRHQGTISPLPSGFGDVVAFDPPANPIYNYSVVLPAKAHYDFNPLNVGPSLSNSQCSFGAAIANPLMLCTAAVADITWPNFVPSLGLARSMVIIHNSVKARMNANTNTVEVIEVTGVDVK